ncbi:MAG: NAD(P)/FAD-dependent oxidoreductase [Oligoflexia bacterium]|nr:NAD(P)/FAD-dependent oxidoreductase [Oligoflexia bacterium]
MLLSSNQNPNDCYDVVVIGAGLGGMTVANILARSGKRVLLLEAHNKLGGFATYFRRDLSQKRSLQIPGLPTIEAEENSHHIFDISLHGFPFGMLKSFRRYWGEAISKLIIPLTDIRFINPEYSIQTSYTREDFTRILSSHFGVREEVVQSFFKRVMSVTPNGEEDPQIPVRELFEEFFPGRSDVVRFLMEPITYANGHTLEDPALTYSIVFANFMKHGIYTIQGGTDLLLTLMREELLANGVDIKFNTLVAKIEVEVNDNHKSTRGVWVKDQLVQSKVVVSNANLLSTIHSLVGEEKLSLALLEKSRQVRLNNSSCQVYIGIKKAHSLPDMGDLVFYSTASHFDTNLLLSDKISSRTFSIYYPRLRPPHGRYTIVASSNARYEDWSELPPSAYESKKLLMVKETLETLEQLIPGISSHIDYLEAATPLTFERYTHHQKGSSFGTKFEGLKVGEHLSQEIQGLYHCGSVGIIMSGWLGAVNFGVITANNIERDHFPLSYP